MKNKSISSEQKPRTSTAVTKADLEVLLALNKGISSVTEISKEVEKAKSTVHDRLNRLIRLEAVKKKGRHYELTKTGKIACSNLMRLSPNKPIFFRLHKYTLSSPFLKKSAELENRLAEGKRFSKNYNFDRIKFHTKSDSVTVQFYPKSISFVLPPVYSPDLIVAEACALRLSALVIDLVEEDFPGTKVGTSEMTSHVDDNHLAIVNFPMVQEFEKLRQNFGEKYCFKGDKIEVDFSDGSVELECVEKLNGEKCCYNIARFCNWVAKEGNFEKVVDFFEKSGDDTF